MLRITPSVSQYGALRYFLGHLGGAAHSESSAAEYLAAESAEMPFWEGGLIEKLSLRGRRVDLPTFGAIVSNVRPDVVDLEAFEDRLRASMARPKPVTSVRSVAVGDRVRISGGVEGFVPPPFRRGVARARRRPPRARAPGTRCPG